MDVASPLPLALGLSPVLPLRAPEAGTATLTFGFRLRLPDGPLVADDDPLLSAFGAFVVAPLIGRRDGESLQDDAFAPGRRVSLVEEGVDGDGDPVVGVWDADGVRRAGHLHYATAAVVAAATEQSLAFEGLVLTEDRMRVDDRRTGLSVLVHAPALVRIDAAGAALGLPRRRSGTPARVVLVADDAGEVRWWDPSGRGGPMELEQLPLSPRLVADLREVSATYATVAGADLADDAMDDMERDMFRVSLEGRLRLLWQRARAELGRGYAVGLQTPGMIGPSWSLAEPDDCDGDIEF